MEVKKFVMSDIRADRFGWCFFLRAAPEIIVFAARFAQEWAYEVSSFGAESARIIIDPRFDAEACWIELHDALTNYTPDAFAEFIQADMGLIDDDVLRWLNTHMGIAFYKREWRYT